MVNYTSEDSGYEVFGANMTVNTQIDLSSGTFACKSCQCNCQQCFACRNMRTGTDEGTSPLEIEKALENLLKEAA